MTKSKLVEVNKKIEDKVVGAYKKIENGVVGGFQKMTDKFVDNYLTKDGESVDEAKERIAKEQKERETKLHQDMEASCVAVGSITGGFVAAKDLFEGTFSKQPGCKM